MPNVSEQSVSESEATREDVQTLAEVIAPDVYEAYRLGKAGKQEYLDDWYSRDAEGPLPDVEIMRLARTILASDWLAARVGVAP